MNNKLTVVFISVTFCAFAGSPAMKKSDASFLAMAAQADMTIAHIGQDAEDRAANDQIKDFGKTLVKDHTMDYQSLTELAAKTGDSIPKGIDRMNDRTIASVHRYKGRTFDHAFLTSESAEHEKLIQAFKQEAMYGTNPDIKAYAQKALPTIEKHLHDAQDLLKQKSI